MVALMVAVVGGSAMSIGQDLNPAAYGSLLAGAGFGLIGFVVVFYVWALLTGVASFAVTIRRLHDLNYSGWFLVLFYAVLVGAAVINKYLYLIVALGWIVVMCLPGTTGANRYGSDPTKPDLDVEAFA
jgi:uncharacterized membrane protein YhaH (DUF805 family)